MRFFIGYGDNTFGDVRRLSILWGCIGLILYTWDTTRDA